MMQKVVVIAASRQRLSALQQSHSFEQGITGSRMADGRVIAVVYPRHPHTRFALAEEDGIVVLPGMHDPAPIGDLHARLAHVDAQPHETMRAIALRLHDAHGPAFHPDT